MGELLALYGEIMDELRSRQVVRTGNAPIGDWAELLFAKSFGWSLNANSTSGHDAVDGIGLRYQIKARRLGHAKASRQLGAIRRLDQKNFDYLAVIFFDSRFNIERAAILPHHLVMAHGRRSEHTNSWTLILDDRVWKEVDVQDVTEQIRQTAATL